MKLKQMEPKTVSQLYKLLVWVPICPVFRNVRYNWLVGGLVSLLYVLIMQCLA